MHARCLLPAVRCSLILHAHHRHLRNTRRHTVRTKVVLHVLVRSMHEVHRALPPTPETVYYSVQGQEQQSPPFVPGTSRPCAQQLTPDFAAAAAAAVGEEEPTAQPTGGGGGGGGLAPVACRAGPCLPPRACACPRPPVRGWPSAFPVGNGRESMGRNSASRVTVDCWGLSWPLHEPEHHPRPKLAGSPYSYHPAYEAVVCPS